MRAASFPWARAALGAAFLLVLAVPARAQMTPLTDHRILTANATYNGLPAHDTESPPGFFLDWEKFAIANADIPDVGYCQGQAYQITTFTPAGLYFAGTTSGAWDNPSGVYDATSSLDWTVQTSTCLSYTLHAEVAPLDQPATCYVRISSGGVSLLSLNDGTIDRTGQLPAGTYRFEGRSQFASSAQNFTAGAYSLVFYTSACSGTFIPLGPRDTTVQCNQVGKFCITPASSGGPFTYQWSNQNGPLPENGHFVGTTTPCLTIQHACYNDVGNYLVAVTSTATGGVEYSTYAHLSISSIAVGVPPGALAFDLGPAVPNPTRGGAVLRYQAPAPFFAHVAVYDGAGRIVRRLADRVLDASGTLTWDGRTTSGAPAVPGIYFLRLVADGRTEMRRLALVR